MPGTQTGRLDLSYKEAQRSSILRPGTIFMKLWLDDVREPWKHGCIGWEWAKTADEAIALLATGQVTEADLDHDLSDAATIGMPAPGEKTGYTVVCWMEENGVWPRDGVRVHSMNPVGAARMRQVIERHYGVRTTGGSGLAF